MKSILLVTLALFSLSAFSNTNIDKFFKRIEGSWELSKVQSPGARFTRYNVTVEKAAKGWSVYEDFCNIDSHEETCAENVTGYELVNGKLTTTVFGDEILTNILASLPTRLNFSFITYDLTVTMNNSFTSVGHWVQSRSTKDTDGQTTSLVIVLKKVN